jgi:hypothetical protein
MRALTIAVCKLELLGIHQGTSQTSYLGSTNPDPVDGGASIGPIAKDLAQPFTYSVEGRLQKVN